MTGGGTDTTSPYSTTYNWTASTTATGAQTVVATNGQALTSNATFTLVNDTTAPTGGALTANGTAASAGGTTSINTSGTISLVKIDYAETQSATAAGLQTSSLTRAFATFSNNACGTFGAPTAVTITGGNDAAGPFSVGCYQYVLTGKDNVDNTVTLTTTVKVYGAANKVVVTSSTANLTSGAARTLTAEVRDANDNLRTMDSSTVVTFAKTAGAGTVTGLGAATASSGVASLPVTAVLAGSITVTASAGGLTSGTTTFTIDPGAADHLTFTSSTANLASGSARTLTAEVRDAANNVRTSDNSTSVTFAKTAGVGTVTGLGAATAASGVASKAVTGSVVGSITITASATGLTSGTTTFTIVAGPADHLTFTSSTANLTSGAGRTLTAEVRDAANNVLTGDNSTSVTFAKTAGAGTLTGLGAATAASGVASKAVTAVLAGSITVTASATGLTSGTTTFTIDPGAADHLTFTSSTANLASALARTLTAEVETRRTTSSPATTPPR